MIRSLITLVCLAMFVWFGMTVPLGKHTLFGHLKKIWHSEEAQELVEGVKEKSAPAVDKVKRGVEAGVREATASDAAQQARGAAEEAVVKQAKSEMADAVESEEK